jgi:hypothetical protein
LDALDKKLGQPECHDPSKAEWMRSIEERLARLEKEIPIEAIFPTDEDVEKFAREQSEVIRKNAAKWDGIRGVLNG